MWKHFFSLVQKLFTFFSASTSRWGILVQYLEGEKRVFKCLSDTRWSCMQLVLKLLRMPKKRIRKPKTQFGDESNGLVLHQHDKFRIEVFLPILDKLSQALTLRTQAYDVVHKRFGFITEFLSMGADEIEKAAQNLQQCYPNLSSRVQTLFLFYRTFEFRQGNADMFIHMYSY